MRYVYLGVLILLVLGVACAGCTGQRSPHAGANTSSPNVSPAVSRPAPVALSTPAQPAVPAAIAGTWVLTTMAVGRGTTVLVPTTLITLTINNDNTISGNGGCNNYFGSFNLTGIESSKGYGITFGSIGSSKMYCQGTSRQETTYLQVLQDASAYDVGSTRLTLTANTQDVLVFQRPSTVPAPGEGALPE